MSKFFLKLAIIFSSIIFCTNCHVDNEPHKGHETHNVRLEDGFQNPPLNAKPSIYYLFLNGYVNKDYLGQELKSLRDKGIGGLCVFDMGGRENKENLPPAGPPFMSNEWLDNFAVLMKNASDLDMNVQLCASSSWDMGASWVKPEEASMALYNASVRVSGPQRLTIDLPNPEFPEKAPKNDQGNPVFQKEIALLALPVDESQLAWEFVFELPPPGLHKLDHVVLYNADDEEVDGGPRYSKEFSVALSTKGHSDEDFEEILHQDLKPIAGAQQFEFNPLEARYIRLKIHSGYNANSENVQLSEFEVYTTDNRNVTSIYKDGARLQDGAVMIRNNSRRSYQGNWGVSKIHDGRYATPNDSWQSDGPPPAEIKNIDNIIDLSARMANGQINWDVPEGTWELIRYVCSNTGELLKVPSPASIGLATDHLNAEATRSYIKYLTDRLEQRFGDLRKTPLNQLYLPSYEVRGQLWTPDLIQKFNEYLSYDITRYLPALTGYIIGSREQTDLFLYDFEKTMGDLLVDAYYRTASKTANLAGLGIEAESGGPGPPVHQVPVDALKALGAIDEIRGEYWPWRPDRGQIWVVKETACAAHIYGKKRVHMEAFTGFRHWQDGPFELKSSADRAFCEGMNHVVWHTSSHQPPEAGKPGWVYHAGTHYTPNLIWYEKSKPFIDYLSRCSFMLQQGLFVADVCYYYGDQGSNFVPPKHIDPSLGFGYDYDVVNAEVILNRMSVEDGRLTLPDGMNYKLLILPDREEISLEVLSKIESFIKSGAIVVGPKPIRATGLSDAELASKKVKELAEKIWGDCDGIKIKQNKYGKGMVVSGKMIREILLEQGIKPDFSCDVEDIPSRIDFIHRRTSQADIYFIRNKTMNNLSVDATFRTSGKSPEIWNPETGMMTDQPVYQSDENGTRVPLHFSPLASFFVIFQKKQGDIYIASVSPGLDVFKKSENLLSISTKAAGEYSLTTSEGKNIDVLFETGPAPLAITGPWKVQFKAQRGAPEQTAFTELISWTEHSDPSIKYYSGNAVYQKEVEVPEAWIKQGRIAQLNLGKLWSVGEVYINGASAGIVWKAPYRLSVTDLLKPGINVLEIEIVNTWSNRLVGDAQPGSHKKYGKTNIMGSGRRRAPWEKVPLNESGLFGPVTLESLPMKEIRLDN